MAKVERPEMYNWWLNELDSLGISTLEKNGLSNHKEASGQDITSFAMSNFGDTVNRKYVSWICGWLYERLMARCSSTKIN
jgi:hypothetical protein